MFDANHYTQYTPLSLTPANGWRAIYAYKDNAGKFAHAHELAVFAITKVVETRTEKNRIERVSPEITKIVGYEAGYELTPAESAINFVAYLAPGEAIPDWQESYARELIEELKKEKESVLARKPVEAQLAALTT